MFQQDDEAERTLIVKRLTAKSLYEIYHRPEPEGFDWREVIGATLLFLGFYILAVIVML